MNVREQMLSKLRLKEDAEIEYKSAKGGFPSRFGVLFLHSPIPMEEPSCWE